MKKYFNFDQLGTNYRTETIAGITTFLSMAYILFLNPMFLSLADVPGVENRMDADAVFTATAVAAAVGTLFMGIIAKYPIALAPGMGLNAFFAYTVILTWGIPWQTALAGVLVSGLIFMVLTISGIREIIINAIPSELKMAVGAGIGLFIAFIGLKNAGIVVADPNTFVKLGDLSTPTTLLAIFGIVVTVIMLVKGIKGGIFYGMILTALAGMVFGLIDAPGKVVDSIPSLAPTFGQAITHLDNIFTLQMLVVILTFLFVDFFDTAGTLMAVANQAGFIKDNKLPRAGRALFADSAATVTGAIVGTSTTTSYIESSAGVGAGGRTGFASIVTAALFLLALFFSPLLGVVTPQVTAAALIIVGVLMASSLKHINWDQFEIAVPAFLTVIAMPLTYSIATGIAIGFVFYPITMIMKGRTKEIHWIMYLLFAIFVCYFAFLKQFEM